MKHIMMAKKVGTTTNSNRDDEDCGASFSSDSNDESQAEAMAMLLGGLTLGDLSMEAWDNESESDHEDEDENDNPQEMQKAAATASDTTQTKVSLSSAMAGKDKPCPSYSAASDDDDAGQIMYARAYSSSREGRMERPPVQIVHSGSSVVKGNICVATRAIRRGETIFTERAAVAANVSSPRVRACPHCLRSLEPASSCTTPTPTSTSSNGNGNAHQASMGIPMPQLWPVPNLSDDLDSLEPVVPTNDNDDENAKTTGTGTLLFRDGQRRLFCAKCDTWFCNSYCLQALEEEMGISHCIVQEIQRGLASTNRLVDGDSPTTHEVQSPVILATRMFLRLRQHYHHTGALEGTFLDGLCGEAADVGPLELGVETRDAPTSAPRYSLQSFYNVLVKKLELTAKEQEILNLTVLERLTAIAARNSVGFRTKSPFKAYYAALLRNAGGWGSDKHQAYMEQLAKALGRQELDRNMDHEIEERVAPVVAGLFALTARINHDCVPNAEIQSQVFVDCHIDLVATRDIAVNEEITISYLGPVRPSTSTARRRRELRAKYLFDCCCSHCLQTAKRSGVLDQPMDDTKTVLVDKKESKVRFAEPLTQDIC